MVQHVACMISTQRPFCLVTHKVNQNSLSNDRSFTAAVIKKFPEAHMQQKNVCGIIHTV